MKKITQKISKLKLNMKVLSLFGAIFFLAYITRPANGDAVSDAADELLRKHGRCDQKDCENTL